MSPIDRRPFQQLMVDIVPVEGGYAFKVAKSFQVFGFPSKTMEEAQQSASQSGFDVRFQWSQDGLKGGPLIACILKMVSRYYHVTEEQILSRDRHEPIASARHIAMFMTRKIVGGSLQDLARLFNREDHGTIMNAVKIVESRIETEPLTRAQIEEITKALQREPEPEPCRP